ncbi:hypothetical protein BC941DRAFT_438619 [Chlamydoabsidia padenii]|nr:hypothetical protein BC941DRAFT_438619 [Chlamydoabsidia padenii]
MTIQIKKPKKTDLTFSLSLSLSFFLLLPFYTYTNCKTISNYQNTMTTKVTLSSPPVPYQKLQDNPEGFQVTPLESHHQDFAQPEDGQFNLTSKRPPTPPKPKQAHAPWKQTRLTKQKETGSGNNGYYSRSPESTQQPTTSTNSSNKDRKPPSMINNLSAAYDHQQYLYHQQALQAESNKDYLLQSTPSKKKQYGGHMDEFFIIQQQLDQTNRERDFLIEENTQLKYHLHILQYRVQNAEYIWQTYYAQMADDHQQRHSWTSSSAPRQQRHPYYYYQQPDYLAGSMPPPPPPQFGSIPPPPIVDLSPNRSLDERNKQYRQHGFRRHRSKSLPRKPSVPENDDPSYPVMMFPPPPPPPPPMMPLLPMVNKFPPRHGRSIPPKRYMHQENNNESDDTGNSDSEEDRRHHRQYKGDGSPMLPFLPHPPLRYPVNLQHMGLAPLGHGGPSDRMYGNISSKRSTYIRDDGIQNNRMQQPSDSFVKSTSQPPSFYSDHQQQSYDSPHRHPY